MPRPAPLPGDLPQHFTVLDAAAKGVSRARLRGSHLESPYWGSRSIRVAAIDDQPWWVEQQNRLVASAQRYAPRLRPGDFFSHTTAAALWGVPLPRLSDDRVHVGTCPPGRATLAKGVQGHVILDALVNLSEVQGLPVASAASTWAQLGSMLPVLDLIIAADAILFAEKIPAIVSKFPRPPIATKEQLHNALSAGRRVGINALKGALARSDTRCASPAETRVRVLLEDAGIPAPELNLEVFTSSGRFLGVVDGAYPALKVCYEYEGDQHRTSPQQFRRDIDKYDALAADGWRTIRLTASHVYAHPGEVVHRVSEALRAAARG